MRLPVLALVVSLFWPAVALAWDVGPPLGSRAPALQAQTASGQPASVRGLTGKNGLVLVFVRSARWCPYCQAQMIQLKDAQGPLAERGYQMAALSYDAPDVLTRFAAQREIPYALLSDQGSKTIDAFKLRDPRYKPGSFAWGVPYASIFVLSPQGVVKAKLAEEDYKKRPPLEAILGAIDGLKR